MRAAAPIVAVALFMAAQADGVALLDRARRILAERDDVSHRAAIHFLRLDVTRRRSVAGFATLLFPGVARLLQEDVAVKRLAERAELIAVALHAGLGANVGRRGIIDGAVIELFRGQRLAMLGGRGLGGFVSRSHDDRLGAVRLVVGESAQDRIIVLGA